MPLISLPEVRASCNLEGTSGHPSCQGTFVCFLPMCERSSTSTSHREELGEKGGTWTRKKA